MRQLDSAGGLAAALAPSPELTALDDVLPAIEAACRSGGVLLCQPWGPTLTFLPASTSADRGAAPALLQRFAAHALAIFARVRSSRLFLGRRFKAERP